MKLSATLLTLVLISGAPLIAAGAVPAGDQAITTVGPEQTSQATPELAVTETVFCSASAFCDESGTWLHCSGYQICNGVDQDCSVGEQGFVFCKGGLIQQCPPCPAASAE